MGRPRAGPGGRADGRPDQALSRPAPTPARPRAACVPPSATTRRTTGNGTCSTRSRAATTCRPGRGRGPGPRGDRDRDRARAHGPAVQPDAGRQDRPAPLRRAHPELRRGAGPALVLRGRPDRAHDPADPLPAVHQGTASSSSTSTTSSTCCLEGGDAGDGGRAAGVVAYRIADGELHRVPGEGGPARDRRLRPDVPDHLERLVADRRRRRAGLPPRRPDAGHGVLPVPPDRDRRASGSCCPRRPAARAATCCNDEGERFMERYAPTLMELAPRDMVSRAIYRRSARGGGSAARTTSTSTSATSGAR